MHRAGDIRETSSRSMHGTVRFGKARFQVLRALFSLGEKEEDDPH